MSSAKAVSLLPVGGEPRGWQWAAGQRQRGDGRGGAAVLQLDTIVAHVCGVLDVEFEELCGKGRRPVVVLARGLVVHLARRHTHLSFPEIARGIGRPTHSTCVHGAQRLQAALDMEPAKQPRVLVGTEALYITELYRRLEQHLVERIAGGATMLGVRPAGALGRS